MFENCKWIWLHNEEKKDEYVDFAAEFEVAECNGVTLDISVDGNFEAYLNGKLCAFGSCADYPNYKFYDSFLLDKFAKTGKNELKITVWHTGVSSSIYATSNAGLIFKVSQKENDLLISNEDVLSRQNANYVSGACKQMTVQMGYSYKFDNTAKSKLPYQKSVAVDKTSCVNPRKIENLVLLPRADAKIEDDGKKLTIDFGRETVGYIDLEFESDAVQELTVAFGEHFDDEGKLPRIIENRDFSIEFTAKKGNNQFLGMMRRIACRYIEIEHESPIRLGYIGIRPVVYPLNKKKAGFANELHKRIYDTCVYTLECCMHEHYEDCPWREQALYSLDSRNQMLCGYIAFEEYRYARYNIILLSKALNNGFLRITSPTDNNAYIPFFSLTFIQQVYEYVEYSKDTTILDEVGAVLDAIINKCSDSIDESGLIPSFPAPAWNFYEWSSGNGGYPYRLRYDTCFNAMLLYVLPMYKKLGGKVEINEKALSESVKKLLLDTEKGLYKNSSDDGRFSLVGNSLAILAGVGDKSIARKLIDSREALTDITLSMN
ncbi:MAG: family 78 glycoside hydrolase catalytic domain, partial [Clostridia bacterium]|nr:family 78 glycoside hydrolase catalytic domain [Clostridia bacterium]